MFKVYKITNKLNGKIYIGQTKESMEMRFRHHCKPYAAKRSAVSRAIQKYGKAEFNVVILEELPTREQANNTEVYWISQYQSMVPHGYNLNAGGKVFEMSDETKKKMSLAKKGIPSPLRGRRLTESHKNKLSVAGKGRPCLHKKPVICLNTGVIYPSSLMAAKDLGLRQGHISENAHGLRASVKGHKFAYPGGA